MESLELGDQSETSNQDDEAEVEEKKPHPANVQLDVGHLRFLFYCHFVIPLDL